METFDIVVLVALGLFAFNGWGSGFVKRIFSLFFLAVAIVAATKYGASLGQFLGDLIGASPGLGTTGGFMVILGAIMIGQAIVYRVVIKKLVEGLWNSLGGVLVGLVEGGLLVSIILIFASLYFQIPSEETRNGSFLYKPLKNLAPRVFDSINTIVPESEDFYQEVMRSIDRFKKDGKE